MTRDERQALREKHREEAAAKVAAEFGPPTEPFCNDWPHGNCVKWTLPNGAEIHAHGESDGPYIDAFSGSDTHARWEPLVPSQVATTPSLRAWLAAVNLLSKEPA